MASVSGEPLDLTLREVEEALVSVLGGRPDRASVSFLGVQPVEILRFDTGGVLTFVSLGMSRGPMTSADEPSILADGPRAELLLQTRASLDDVWRRLAVLAAAPAVEGVVYRPGMTIDLGVPIRASSRCTGGLIVHSAIPPISSSAGLVDVLRVLPATSTELAWARVRGADALVQRWDADGVDLLDLDRSAVSLT